MTANKDNAEARNVAEEIGFFIGLLMREEVSKKYAEADWPKVIKRVYAQCGDIDEHKKMWPQYPEPKRYKAFTKGFMEALEKPRTVTLDDFEDPKTQTSDHQDKDKAETKDKTQEDAC